MFGTISLADAAVFATIAATVIAILKGGAHGAAAKTEVAKTASAVSISGSIVDAMEFGNYVKALDKLAIAMNRHADALDRQHEVKHTNALEELAEKIYNMGSRMELKRPQPRPHR